MWNSIGLNINPKLMEIILGDGVISDEDLNFAILKKYTRFQNIFYHEAIVKMTF